MVLIPQICHGKQWSFQPVVEIGALFTLGGTVLLHCLIYIRNTDNFNYKLNFNLDRQNKNLAEEYLSSKREMGDEELSQQMAPKILAFR